MFQMENKIGTLFTIAKTCKQPKSLLTDEWRRCSTYTQWNNSLKKEWNNAICNGLRDDHTKRNKSDKNKHHLISLICGI